MSYLQKIVKDSMERGEKQQKPIRIKDRLAAAKTEAERINSERSMTKTIPDKGRER